MEDIKATIRCIHKIWYDDDWINDASKALKLHRHLEVLFNFADITDSLVENNPNEVSPEEFKQMTGATE